MQIGQSVRANFGRFTAAIGRLNPGAQRLIWIGGVVGLFLFGLWVVMPGSNTTSTTNYGGPKGEVGGVLLNGTERDDVVQSLVAEVKRLQTSADAHERALAALRGAVDEAKRPPPPAAPVPAPAPTPPAVVPAPTGQPGAAADTSKITYAVRPGSIDGTFEAGDVPAGQQIAAALAPATVWSAPGSVRVAGADLRSSGSTVPTAPAAVHVFRQDVAAGPRAESAPLGVEPVFRLPPGSILSGVLLTGLDAPTALAARRDPMPALLRVKQDTILPNQHSADQRECFVLVSGYGDLSAERAYLRGEDLSCVLADGTTFHERIEGYVVGEDGRAGMNGKVVSRQGAFIARSLVVGIMEGIAQAFGRQQSYGIGVNQGQLSFQQAGDQTTGGAVSGAAKGLDRIADFYLQQAVAMFPVVEILAGRKVDLVLTNEVRVKLPAGAGE